MDGGIAVAPLTTGEHKQVGNNATPQDSTGRGVQSKVPVGEARPCRAGPSTMLSQPSLSWNFTACMRGKPVLLEEHNLIGVSAN